MSIERVLLSPAVAWLRAWRWAAPSA